MLRLCLLPLLLWACKDSPSTDDSNSTDDSADDTGSPPVTGWDWCPADGGQGLGEGATLQIGASAMYCGGSDESRSLAEELAAKVQVYLPPQSLSLPAQTQSGAFTLPACARFGPDLEGPVSSGEGALDLRVDTYGSETWHQVTLTQPLQSAADGDWTLTVSLWGQDAPSTLVLDGDSPSPDGLSGASLSLCKGDCEDYSSWREALSCTFASEDSDRHHFEFEGGELTLDLRIGQSMASTEPAMLVGAEGALDGVDFEQTDYWKLIYNPEHHHFSRDAQVWFDSPIGEVCALELRGFDPWGEGDPTTVTPLDCEGAALPQRALTEETYERVD